VTSEKNMVIQVSLNDQMKYGIKRTCRSCGIGFYDLDRHPSECPNCGALYELHVTARSRRVSDDVLDVEENLDNLPFDIDGVEEVKDTPAGGGIVEDDPFDI
jgi:hypothetical protein